jgi:hypothetical protein
MEMLVGEQKQDRVALLLDPAGSGYVLQHITAPMFCVRLCSGGLSGITSSLLDAI